MKNHAHPRGSTCFPLLLVLGLTLSAGSATAQEHHLVAETYGRASGDTPSPELGLVLELVDGGSPDARLRLFGGIPGQPATIVVSASKTSTKGTNGAIALVGPALVTASGTFDWHGIYELPLGALEPAAGQVLYAQGSHLGILDLGAGALRQLSHGLELRRAQTDEAPLWFDDLLPHLPDAREISGSQGLSEKLQSMLNSADDSVRISIELELTAGLGIEVVDVKAGAKSAVEFTVERTPEGLYEVQVANEFAGLAGISAGTGLEAGLEGSGGYGAAQFFRFHSAPGAARGILGLVLALRFPELQPGRLLENTGILGDAGARVRELQELVRFAEATVAELEATLWQVLEQRVDAAEAARASAAASLATANRNYANAPLYLRPVYWTKVLACRVALAAADARLAVVRTARDQGAIAVAAAKAVLAHKLAELADAMAEVTRIGRLAASIAQLRGWATDHFAGKELRFKTATEAEAQIKLPVVDLKNFGLGMSRELEQEFILRREPASGGRPARVTLIQSLQLESKAYAGFLVGGEVACQRKLEVAETYDVVADALTPTGKTVSFTRDCSAVKSTGMVYVDETGVGRTRSFSLADSVVGDLASLSSPEALLARIGAMQIGFELQDRRQENHDVAVAVDVSGTGGGLEFELEWADQGRLLSRSTTVGEGVESVLHGATEVIDEATGTVRAVQP